VIAGLVKLQPASVDPEIKHGAVVFRGTRFAIEDAINYVTAYQEWTA
jgi:uncharacterized protein (DUF433 family)